jgi:molybdate transport system permease protein
VVFAALAAVALTFLALPVVAIFLRVSPATLIRELDDPVARDALLVSLKTSVIAQALIVAFGTPTAYLLATHRFRGRSVLVTLVELPLVLPPAVAGIGLLAAFGRTGLLSTSVAFTQTAVVLAVTFVAAPVLRANGDRRVRGGRPDSRRRGARHSAHGRWRARSGASRCRSRQAASVPGSRCRSRAVSASSARRSCSPARCSGVTQTLPLAIYAEFDSQLRRCPGDRRTARRDQRSPSSWPSSGLAGKTLIDWIVRVALRVLQTSS